jgi:hypothetical protein
MVISCGVICGTRNVSLSGVVLSTTVTRERNVVVNVQNSDSSKCKPFDPIRDWEELPCFM